MSKRGCPTCPWRKGPRKSFSENLDENRSQSQLRVLEVLVCSSRESHPGCFMRILRDFGQGYLLGFFGGGLMQTYYTRKTFVDKKLFEFNPPPKPGWRYPPDLRNRILQRASKTAFGFGRWTGLFGLYKCVLAVGRQKYDGLNPIIAGGLVTLTIHNIPRRRYLGYLGPRPKKTVRPNKSDPNRPPRYRWHLQFRAFLRGFLFIGVLEVMMMAFSQDRLDINQTIETYPGTHAQRMEMALRDLAARASPQGQQ